MKDIDDILLGKLNKDFTFPEDGSFEVSGIRFTFDEAQEGSSFFGPDVRLWADGVMIFKDHKIDVPGGMGQVEHTYSKLQQLRERVDRLRKQAAMGAAEAKKRSVIDTLLSAASSNAA